MHFVRLLMIALLTAVLISFGRADGQEERPIAVVAGHAFRMMTKQGAVEAPELISQDWSHPLPEVTRAIIVVHGKGRNAEGYYKSIEEAAKEAGRPVNSGTLLIAPQFLDETDAAAHHLPAEVLRWKRNQWEAGEPAAGPLPLSVYDVLDMLVQHLSDRKLFPNLQAIVLAGHSAGGQTIQRYAVVGKAEALAGGIPVRFVVANPSSYVYFSDDRPTFKKADFSFAPYSGEGAASSIAGSMVPLTRRPIFVSAAPISGRRRRMPTRNET